MRRFLTILAVMAGLSALAASPAALADPVAPEEAFEFSARVLDAETIEATYRIRKGYYLYRGKLGFGIDPASANLGTAELPPGEQYKDEFFGETEIYRGTLRILIPVSAPEGVTQLDLTGNSQGCWDGGICYPPMTQHASLDLNAPTGVGVLDRSLSGPAGSGGTARVQLAQESSLAGDESGRVAGLLRDASFALILASFFGFGLLLAFTPCVFPMIPILSGIIVGQGQHITRGRAFALSLAYVVGMAVTYALAGVAAGLSGTMLTAALQNVWVLGSFAVVFVLLSLSMFGFYELQLPSSVQSRLSSTASHQKGGSLGGVTVMGVLSALIVGPCVAAPLAGALLYIAQTGDG